MLVSSFSRWKATNRWVKQLHPPISAQRWNTRHLNTYLLEVIVKWANQVTHCYECMLKNLVWYNSFSGIPIQHPLTWKNFSSHIHQLEKAWRIIIKENTKRVRLIVLLINFLVKTSCLHQVFSLAVVHRLQMKFLPSSTNEANCSKCSHRLETKILIWAQLEDEKNFSRS